MASNQPACFKAYDIRGRVPDQLNVEMAREIGRAYASIFNPATVAVGHDIELQVFIIFTILAKLSSAFV